MRKIFLGLVFMMLFTGVWQANAQTAQQVTVKVGERKTVDKQLAIKFVELVSDSRCPADVRCVWAGNAKLKIELSRAGESKVFEINTGMKPQSVVFDGYEIKIVALNPRLKKNVRINPKSYTATFSVAKSK